MIEENPPKWPVFPGFALVADPIRAPAEQGWDGDRNSDVQARCGAAVL